MQPHQRDFLDLALHKQVLRFGEFTLKSGRTSPYFFNAGLIDSGAALARLGRAYATTAVQSGLAFDMLFGPAYKGIALAAATAIALAGEHDRDLPFAFNRKEAKTHGEGGKLIGAPLAGRVLIVDDVITAGTAIRESLEIIRAAGKKESGAVFRLMTLPGIWMQNLTTREPSDDQLEVAIYALKESLKLEPEAAAQAATA